MLIDLYGSRTNLLSILKIKKNLNLTVSNIFIGTTIESQTQKEVKIEEERLENFTSPFELIEINTDFSKRLRLHNQFPKSSVIILDFLHEGRQSIKYKNGTMVNRAVLRRYGYSLGNGSLLSLGQKIDNIEHYVDELIEYISSYDLVIVNQLRSPKKAIIEDEIIKKNNQQEINFLNYYAETFEEILLDKLDTVHIIPQYRVINELYDGYHNTEEYQQYFENEMKKILNKTILV